MASLIFLKKKKKKKKDKSIRLSSATFLHSALMINTSSGWMQSEPPQGKIKILKKKSKSLPLDTKKTYQETQFYSQPSLYRHSIQRQNAL